MRPLACSSSLVPLPMPWARWQRNPRAGGLAARSDQSGTWVLQRAAVWGGGSAETAPGLRHAPVGMSKQSGLVGHPMGAVAAQP